jgi:hypothetical protein
MSDIDDTLLWQVEHDTPKYRRASARIEHYGELIRKRIDNGGYNEAAMQWAARQCQIASEALEAGDIDAMLEAFDLMRNVVRLAETPKLREQMEHVGRIAIEAMQAKDRTAMLLVRRTEDARAHSSTGGRSSAAKRKAMPAWMIEVFDRAYALAESDGHVSPGRKILEGYAWRVAGRDHPDREKLKDSQVRKYLSIRKKRASEN